MQSFQCKIHNIEGPLENYWICKEARKLAYNERNQARDIGWEMTVVLEWADKNLSIIFIF